MSRKVIRTEMSAMKMAIEPARATLITPWYHGPFKMSLNLHGVFSM